MACDELAKPRIRRNEIRNIILGGGQNLLSPERRFDAIIYNSPDLEQMIGNAVPVDLAFYVGSHLLEYIQNNPA